MVGYSEIAGTPMLVKHISNWSVPLWMEIKRICLNTCCYVNMCLGNWDAPRKSFLVWWGMVCLTGWSRWREYKQGLCTLYIGGFSENHQYHLDCPEILFFFFRFSPNVFNCLSVLYNYYYIFVGDLQSNLEKCLECLLLCARRKPIRLEKTKSKHER